MKAVAEDKPLVVRISEQKETRSLAQNRLYWLWLDTFAKEMGDSSDYYHVFFKRRFLSKIYYRDDEFWQKTLDMVRNKQRELSQQQYELYALEVAEKIVSTKFATTKQMKEYLDLIHDFCMKQGVGLQVPEDLKWVMK